MILYQYFKYFDINSTGLCSFQDFIKVNKRLGLFYNNDSKNLEKIFLYFAEPDTSLLIYKKFCQEIFYFISSNERNYINKNINIINNYNRKESFLDILMRKILDKNGPFTLLELIKNIKIIDYQNSNIIFFNDFIRVLKRTDIFLEEEEKVTVFEQCDYYRNKNLHYQNMFNLLVNQFWTEEKNHLCEEIFFTLTDNGRRCISIYYIQQLFQNMFNKSDLVTFLDQYKLINKNNSLEPISLKDFIILFKYYTFGEYDSDFLKDFYYSIKQENNIDKKDNYSKLKNYFNNDNKNKKKKKYNYSKSVGKNIIKEKDDKNNLYKIIIKIKNFFIEYGRISLFNFIKQFKYYETNDNLINRNNFRKVFNNFNIKLTSDEIDSIFNELGVDYSKNFLYHEDFIKYISVKCLNKKQDEIIKSIYDALLQKRGKYNENLTIKYLKEEYNAKNNYFIINESDNYLEFIDCLEIFHFNYKGFKSDKFDKKEFVEFYRLISFLINDDKDFICLISNEWKIPLNNFDNYNSVEENNTKEISNTIGEKDKNYNLSDLKSELIKKGVKGLLNIHWQFMSLCPNVSKISLADFINIMNLNKINFSLNEIKEIFNYFSNDITKKYLDYNSFIRFFKKELNQTKLDIVEKIFLSLKYDFSEDKDEIPLNIIKKKYKAKRHPEVITEKATEEEKIKEFKESFDINYNILNSEQNKSNIDKLVDFDIFANFYEYVSFIYEEDEQFVNLLMATWC